MITICVLGHLSNFVSLLTCAVTALQDLYRSLNQPPELTGWKLDGGDPCVELWTGVSCFESSIIYL